MAILPDHDQLVALTQQVAQHTETLDRLDDESRVRAVRLGQLETHIDGLQASHAALTATIATLDRKMTDHQYRTETRLTALDDKVDTRLDRLQDHFDASFTAMHDEVTDTITAKEMALPRWAQVGLYMLSVGVGILAGIIAALNIFH
jgi:chromosome segregation ATPase